MPNFNKVRETQREKKGEKKEKKKKKKEFGEKNPHIC